MEKNERENAIFDSPEHSESEEKVLALAGKQGAVTRKEIEKLLGIDQSTSGRLVKRMVKDGLMFQDGKGKSTKYRLPK